MTGTGSITTYGNFSTGIFIDDTLGNVTISVLVSGNITTHDYGAQGISVENTDGSVSVTASGAIVTGKYYSSSPADISYADGIYLNTTEGSALVTLPAPAASRLMAARLVESMSAIQRKRQCDRCRIDIHVWRCLFRRPHKRGIGRCDSHLRQTGRITTYGDYADGVLAMNSGANVTVTASGITTFGGSAHGVFITNSYQNVIVTAGGDIATHRR